MRPSGFVLGGMLALVGVSSVAMAADTSSERKFQIGRPSPKPAEAPEAVAPPKPLEVPVPYAGSLASAPVLDWKVRLPGGRVNAASHTERSGPVILDHQILVGGAAGRALFALSRQDGSLLREYPALGPVQASPTVAADRLYFGDTGGRLWCYTLEGQEVWHFDTGAPILVAPAFVDGRLYLTNVADVALAVDANNGTLLWQYQRKPDLTREAELTLFGKPPAVIDGDRAIFGFSDGAVVVLDREKGDELWSRRVGEGRYPDLVAAPIVHGGTLFSAGYYAPLMALDPADGTVRWRVEVGAAWAPLAVDRDGTTWLYHPGGDGKLRAFDAATGAEVWSWYSGDVAALTTPILTEAGLVVGSSEGGVSLVDPDTGKTRWNYRGETLLSGVSAMPVVHGRQLAFVTNAGFLYSLRSLEPQTMNERAGTAEWSRRTGP